MTKTYELSCIYGSAATYTTSHLDNGERWQRTAHTLQLKLLKAIMKCTLKTGLILNGGLPSSQLEKVAIGERAVSTTALLL